MTDESISLYFGLREGRRADLEVVAEAVLKWIEALRIAADVIEPGSQITVEIIDAEEGSLWLNAALDWAEKQLTQIQEGAVKYPRLKKLAIALAIFIPVSGVPTFDFYFGNPTSTLSEEDQKLIKELLDQLKKSQEMQDGKSSFYRILERDPSITSVGIAEVKRGPLLASVPSGEFAELGGLWRLEEESHERTIRPVLEVTLISPVLVGSERSWRFKPTGLPEFWAVMKDKQFLKALDEDHVRERLRTGIPMTIRLEVKEQWVDGEWKVRPRGRSVTEVISPKVS